MSLGLSTVPATVRRYFKGPEFIAVSLWRGKAAKPEETISFTKEMVPTYDVLKQRLHTLFKPHNESNFHIHSCDTRKCHGHGEISPQVYDSLFTKSRTEAKDPARVLYAHFGFKPMSKPLIKAIANPIKPAATKKPASNMFTAATAKLGLAWPQFGFGAPAPRKRAALDPLPMLPSPPKKRKISPPEQPLATKEAKRQGLASHKVVKKVRFALDEQPAAKENAGDKTTDAPPSSTKTSSPPEHLPASTNAKDNGSDSLPPSTETNEAGDPSASPPNNAKDSAAKPTSRKRKADDDACDSAPPAKKMSFWGWFGGFPTLKKKKVAPAPISEPQPEQDMPDVEMEEGNGQPQGEAEPERAYAQVESAAAVDTAAATPTASTTTAAAAPAATNHWASPAQLPHKTGLIPIGWLKTSGHVLCASLGRNSTVVYSRSAYNREGVKIDTHTTRFELAFPALLDVEFAPEFDVLAEAGTLHKDLRACLLTMKENREAQPGLSALKFDIGVGGQSFELKKLRGNRFMVGVVDDKTDGCRDHADGRKNVVSVAPRRINHPARGWIVEPIVRVEELDEDGEFLAMPERLVDVDWEKELIDGEHSMWGWESVVSWNLLPELELVGKLRVGRTVGRSFKELAKMME